MSRAEEAALKACPDLNREEYFDDEEWIDATVRQHSDRALYRIAYQQAEKDLTADWTEEDERIRANLLSLLVDLRVGGKIKETTAKKYYDWLKTIHVKPRKPRS